MGGTEIAGFLPELYEILLSVARKTATFHRKINGMDVVQGERLTPNLIADLRRRSAIEPEIGHMKTDGRLSRCPLKGTIGDALFAVLCACGHNIRKILAHLRALFAWIVAALWAAVRCQDRKYQTATTA